jgi:hypothetical protein
MTRLPFGWIPATWIEIFAVKSMAAVAGGAEVA